MGFHNCRYDIERRYSIVLTSYKEGKKGRTILAANGESVYECLKQAYPGRRC